MARTKNDPTDLPSGTYEVPGVGTVHNGKLLDGNDPEAVAAFHAGREKSADQAQVALAERDEQIVAVVTADAPEGR